MQSKEGRQSSSLAVSELDLRIALDIAVRDSLRPITAGLGALYVIFAVSHQLVLPRAAAALMSPVAYGTAALLLGLHLVLGHWTIPSRWAHPVATGIAGLVLLNSLLHLFLLPNPQQTTNLMLLAIGVGCVFFSTAWLVLVLTVTFSGWGLVVWGAPTPSLWVHFGFGLLSAGVLSVLIHTVRVRAFRRLEGLRLQDERRKRELEKAVQVKQHSEEALRKAHVELERRVQERTEALAGANRVLQAEIAERKRLEEALQQERDLLGVTLASIGDAVIATDATATLTFMNAMAEVLTGWKDQEAVGKKIEEVFPLVHEHTWQRVENPVEKALREKRVVDLANQTVLIARDGRKVPIADNGAPICDKNGHVYGAVMVFRDVTVERQTAATLVEAKEAAEAANHAKSEFLAMMSHELRTPLHIIMGYTDLLLEEANGKWTSDQLTMLQAIARSAEELFELIAATIDVSRLEADRLVLEVRPIRLLELMNEIEEETRSLQEKSGLCFTWHVTPELPLLYTDPLKLKIIIKNLLNNAVKFTPEGSIVVKTASQESGVEISVSDTGIGIAPEVLPIIFDMFRQGHSTATRHYGGVGLGLYIVRRLLESLEGRITVESQVGRGSTFRVWIPTTIAPFTPCP